jgi:hypothetical protein
MAGGTGRPRDVSTEEQELLGRIVTQITRCSEHEHRLARRRRILQEAATQLRLGRPAHAVLAQIHEQVPEAVTVIGEESTPITVPAVQRGRGRRRTAPDRGDDAWLRRQLEGLDGPPVS